MNRFFVEEKILDNKIIPKKELLHQLKNVLRIKKNEKFIIINNSIEYLAILENNKILIIKKLENNRKESNKKITLIQSIIKPSRIPILIQKSTELGVDEIFFWESKYSNTKNEIIKNKIKRYEKIATEASEQSRRITIPKIDFIKNDLFSFIEKNVDLKNSIFIVPYENEKKINIKEIDISNYNNVFIIIGPEGGFHIDEINKFNDKNFSIVSLGENTLRSETASFFTIGIIRNFL